MDQILEKIEGRGSSREKSFTSPKNRKPTQATMQATEAAATVYHTVPVMPTEESQADKGIDHPLVSCGECDAVWRAHGRSRCPICAEDEGYRMSLTSHQTSNLFVAMSDLQTKECYTEEQMDLQIWRFRNLLRSEAPWYDINSRQMIQACYEYVSVLMGAHPATPVAIALFKEDFQYAPEEEKTVFPEVIRYQERDAQYDLQHPSW
jgi:hypothetical protein